MVCHRFVAVSQAEIVSGLELTVHYMFVVLFQAEIVSLVTFRSEMKECYTLRFVVLFQGEIVAVVKFGLKVKVYTSQVCSAVSGWHAGSEGESLCGPSQGL